MSNDRRAADITVRTIRGLYHARIAGEEKLWMIRTKELPGGFTVKYLNNTDGTLSDIHVEQGARYDR